MARSIWRVNGFYVMSLSLEGSTQARCAGLVGASSNLIVHQNLVSFLNVSNGLDDVLVVGRSSYL